MSLMRSRQINNIDELFELFPQPNEGCVIPKAKLNLARMNTSMPLMSEENRYTPSNVVNLLKDIGISQRQVLDQPCFYMIRYLLTVDKQLVFGRGGVVSVKHPNTPAHSQLTSKEACLAAGDIVFTSQYEVININNSSSDFNSHYSVLSQVLIALDKAKFSLAKEVKFDIFDGVSPISNTIKVAKPLLDSWLKMVALSEAVSHEKSSDTAAILVSIEQEFFNQHPKPRLPLATRFERAPVVKNLKRVFDVIAPLPCVPTALFPECENLVSGMHFKKRGSM